MPASRRTPRPAFRTGRGLALAPLGALAGADPWRPGAGEARGWAVEELSGPAYQESLVDRFLNWLAGLFDIEPGTGGLSASSIVAVLVALAVALLAFFVVRAARARRHPAVPATEPVLDETPLSAAAYRARAAACLADGDAAQAVIEAFRAICADGLARGLLVRGPASTAHEAGLDLGGRYPAYGEALASASAIFDRARYGAHPPTLDQARRMIDLDAALGAADPSAAPGARLDVVVPR